MRLKQESQRDDNGNNNTRKSPVNLKVSENDFYCLRLRFFLFRDTISGKVSRIVFSHTRIRYLLYVFYYMIDASNFHFVTTQSNTLQFETAADIICKINHKPHTSTHPIYTRHNKFITLLISISCPKLPQIHICVVCLIILQFCTP